MRVPSVSIEYMELQCRGEISPYGAGRTPFYPSTVTDPYYVPNEKMVYMYISDYVVNSAFYHAYRSGKLDIDVSPDSEQVGGISKNISPH